MMKKRLVPFLALCAAGAVPLSAEVFSLWPFQGNDAYLSDSADSVLNPAKLWTEEVSVNGRKLEMSVAMVSTPFDVCLRTLRAKFPDSKFAANPSSAVMERTLPGNLRERVLLLSLNGVYPVIRFRMLIPEEVSNPGEWPSEIPVLPGANLASVMRFPKRNAVCAMFSSADGIRNALPRMTAALEAGGWAAVSNENIHGTGSGEIFLNAAKNSILILGLTEKKDGSGCSGTVYARPLGK